MSLIPALNNTPADSIPSIASKVRITFASHKTRPLAWRKQQLAKLYWAMMDNTAALEEALKIDLGRGQFEAHMADIRWCTNDAVFVYSSLEKWAKDEAAEDIPITYMALNARIRKDPLGAVLIIGTYNFPVQLTIGPLIGAIAAGCTAILKPSENAPATAAVIQKIVESSLDPSAYAIVQGAIPETTALLNEKWDKIFYTGGGVVAKVIAKKAAETLTPIALELGGKNPAIITKNADVKLAARRLLWGKTMNAGQVCVSHNYTLIDESMLDTFVAALKATLAEFYPNGAKASPDYARIINGRQWQRLKKLLEASNGRILIGGSMDESDRFLEPTVVQVSSTTDSLLEEETFGPIITILPVKDLDSAIRIANEVSGTPLGVYGFGNKAETKRILDETRSGGATINDSFFHASIPTLAFGGVGDSGQGSYRGRASFDVFTHRRSVVTNPAWMEMLLGVRYPPFVGTNKGAQLQKMSDQKPAFDRQGLPVNSLLTTVLALVQNTIGASGLGFLGVALVAYIVGYFSRRG